MKWIISTRLLRLDDRRLAVETEFEVEAVDWFDALRIAEAWAREAETPETTVVYHVRPALS